MSEDYWPSCKDCGADLDPVIGAKDKAGFTKLACPDCGPSKPSTANQQAESNHPTVPQDRARDTRRVVAIGKMGPAFGRSGWSDMSPSFQWRKEGSMNSEHGKGETELWSSKRDGKEQLHPF